MHGATTLNNTLTMVGDKATGSDGALTVDESTTPNNALMVVGDKASGLSGALPLDGETTLKKKLNVEATPATKLGWSVTVDAATTLKGKLTVQGGHSITATQLKGKVDASGTADQLTTARNINGVAFNGTKAITVNAQVPDPPSVTEVDIDFLKTRLTVGQQKSSLSGRVEDDPP